uniref:Uncharacterized protein n=1 Tax=Romanomermis culicivorax TaxID=13658 RepID=A0A915I8C0_ROMCU
MTADPDPDLEEFGSADTDPKKSGSAKPDIEGQIRPDPDLSIRDRGIICFIGNSEHWGSSSFSKFESQNLAVLGTNVDDARLEDFYKCNTKLC